MTGFRDTSRGDLLVERILRSETETEPGVLANDLLDAFWSGYPIEHLRRLLRHPDSEVVEVGAFLAQELVGLIAPVMDDVRPLLGHASFDVRFDALSAVLDNEREDGETIARALMMAQDSHRSVRWKALRFASLADRQQLEAAVPCLAPAARLALESSGLLDGLYGEAGVRRKVRDAIDNADELVRRWATCAAVRSADTELLAKAAASTDAELATFATDELKSLTKFGPAPHDFGGTSSDSS
jgi:hypothetical protein